MHHQGGRWLANQTAFPFVLSSHLLCITAHILQLAVAAVVISFPFHFFFFHCVQYEHVHGNVQKSGYMTRVPDRLDGGVQ